MNEPSERYDFASRNVTGTYPIDWKNDLVPIQLWSEQERTIEHLRDDVKDLEDCRELLRRLGQLCGCDHVDGADERLVQVQHIEEEFERLHETIREREDEIAIQFRQRNLALEAEKAAAACLREARERVKTLEGHLDWIGWDSVGMERRKAEVKQLKELVSQLQDGLSVVTKQRDHYLAMLHPEPEV